MAATSVSVEDLMGKAISNEILGSPVHIFLKTEKGSTSQGTGFYFVAGEASVFGDRKACCRNWLVA